MLYDVQAEVDLYGLRPEYGSFLINIANYASIASSGEGGGEQIDNYSSPEFLEKIIKEFVIPNFNTEN
jgi:hypothetical protein